MSLVTKTRPMIVSFKISQHKLKVSLQDQPTKIKTSECNWPQVVKAMEQFYPDMEIGDPKLKGITITFPAKFKNRPTTEDAIRWRLYNFLAYTPTMKVSDIQVKPKQ